MRPFNPLRYEIWSNDQIAVLVRDRLDLGPYSDPVHRLKLVESFEDPDPSSAFRYFRRWATLESFPLDRSERVRWGQALGVAVIPPRI